LKTSLNRKFTVLTLIVKQRCRCCKQLYNSLNYYLTKKKKLTDYKSTPNCTANLWSLTLMDKKNLTCYILWLHMLQKTISHFLAVQELLLLRKKIISEKKPTLTQTYETKRKSWHDVQNKQTNTYSELSNKHAANLILFEKFFPPTCLIWTYTFIYFRWKFLPTRLLESPHSLILAEIPN